jgi:hypothetical protein
MNIKLLYYLISKQFKEYDIKNTDNLNNYLSNLDNLIINKQKELAYLKANNISNIDLLNIIKSLKNKYNSITNILNGHKNNILAKINNLNDSKLYLNYNYSDKCKNILNKYINHNILYYNCLLNSELIWHEFDIRNHDYIIEDVLNEFNNYNSINNNILCIINYDLYKFKYIDYILLEYLDLNKWDLSNITNYKISLYINNKINSDLGIDKTININFIMSKMKLLLKIIKENITNYHNNNIDEIIIYLSTIFNYIILNFNVEYWKTFIQYTIQHKKLYSKSTKYTTNTLENNTIKKHTNITDETEHKQDENKNEEDYIDTEDKNEEDDEDKEDKNEEDDDKNTEEKEDEEDEDNEEDEEDDIDSLILPDNITMPHNINKNNTIKFNIKNNYAWLSLDWPDVDNKVINDIHINYDTNISKSKININDVKFNNLIIYLYLKKIKYLKEFIDENNINMHNYIKHIFDEEGNYIEPNKIIDLLNTKFDTYIITHIESEKKLNEFNELIRDWNINKIEVLRKGLYNKYLQNETLKIALLNTKDKYLIDQDNIDDNSKNIVGILSMQIRYMLENKSK